MKRVLVLFLWAFFSEIMMAQVVQKPSSTLVKDDFFQKNTTQQQAQQAEKVKLVHSDQFGVQADKYEGNPWFSGNVQFSHQGSVLSADEVVLYREQNFIKAKGNVKLQNADGSVITAEEMEYDGNTQRGIARKNVVLTDPKQTIKTDVLYYDRLSNQAYFNTGGVITSDNNTMYTKAATYNVSSKIIDFTGNVKIDNPQYIVEGTNIKQHQATNTAEFFGATKIINKQNPANYVYTEQGRYLMNQKEVFLNKNSRIHYNGKILTGNEMYYNQISGFGKAKGNVTLDDPTENRFIKGGYGEIYEKIDSAMITEKPYAVKVLKTDSIYFAAEKILAFQKPDSTFKKKSYLRAFNKGRMFKSNAQARADSISFDETDGILHLNRKPILWSGEKQVTGDKIEVYFDTENEAIDSLKVIGNAFAISKADSLNNKDEFNQVKSRVMLVFYQNNEVKTAQALGNAQAITYAENQNEKTKEMDRIGVSLSTCGVIEAEFEERQMQIVSCNIGAKTDVFPMSKIARDQRFFPDFNWNTKDRLQKWTDIFIESPNYPEKHYESDNSLYQQAQDAIKKEQAKSQNNKIKRVKK
ncbi:MAG: OstA-like protein [Bergeyella zoohelcum]|nr:OstA-like protein [Bergeyella zoohelcum]